jgi:hypothetical protein
MREVPREYGYGVGDCHRCRHLMERIEKKLDLLLQQQGAVMADVSAANAILSEIDGEQSELVSDYSTLLEKIATLSTEHPPTEAELADLTSHAAKIAAGFKALHEAESTDAPAPVNAPPAETPVVTPPVETPPVTTEPALPTNEPTPPSTETPPASTETPPPAA